MKPVADMNLATYLSATANLEDRKNCLRRFFGCLATAVDYLHSQKVRHKDIKPENILVKDRSVLLTDFGTSHNWADDSKSSTSGTIGAFTRRYCAPEVAAYATRNPASDIWSLGCVFIEMSTVLMNRTIQELRKFYEENGTKGHTTKPWIWVGPCVVLIRWGDRQRQNWCLRSWISKDLRLTLAFVAIETTTHV
ncbi:hypothetical protein GJ744_000284 [Endocarpon pusillum]|uniref:Protein kinase domain-containing protein n=1 Tax=Endocarpon pusillum TaxID=364733 RepID=A0A8H7AR52_9EURO|nr:hypothetical protein GJ744_000284 [Endocarpon pusillum]